MNTQQLLLDWYLDQKRDLPWRKNRDPYRIWISETMLQQTTSTAVIPYYERFLKKFPTIKRLASADVTEVLDLWGGLGYYSRAHNLHRAAKLLAKKKSFPKSHQELLQLPGFGPYTARAVSSIAFSEPVGILDGNVIRVMTRFLNLNWEWWRPRVRTELQRIVDQFVKNHPAHILNQALMELGSQICVPKSPKCLMCPIISQCEGRKNSTWHQLPIKKPRRARELWEWHPVVETNGDRVRLMTNDYAPFLRGNWLLPGKARLLNHIPKKFNFRHSITHHDIFVNVTKRHAASRIKRRNSERWVRLQDIKSVAPYSLVKKALVACGLTIAVSACQSTKTLKPNSSAPVVLEKVGPYSLLSQFGINRTPQFSPGGHRLLYVSSNRLSHSNPQLYERNLSTSIEHRLTFQDGEVFDGTYARGGKKVIYSSSTDEIKENPRYLTDAIANFKKNSGSGLSVLANAAARVDASTKDFWGDPLPPTDLYETEINSSTFRRLTKAYAFHGEVSASPKSNEIVFAIMNDGHLELFRMNLKTHASRQFFREPNSAVAKPNLADEWPKYSPDGKLVVWVHETSVQNSEIWLAKANGSDAHKLIGGDAVYWTPSWSPAGDEILFSSNRNNPSEYDLYAIKPDGSCARQLSQNDSVAKPFRMWQAELSPDLSEIVFTSDVSGSPQIYKWAMDDATRTLITKPTCPITAPTATPPAVITPTPAAPPTCPKPPCAIPTTSVPSTK